VRFAKPPVTWAQTENFGYPKGQRGRNGQSVIGICYHIAEGSRGSVESWFGSPKSQASSHFLVCRDGAIVQFVDEEDAAWTQGDTQAVTWPLYDRAVNPNLQLIGIEHEGYFTDPWTEEEFQADVALTLHLCERFGIAPRRPYLLGHYELNGKTRPNCPGPHFPWSRLLDEVQRAYARELIPWMADALTLGYAYNLTDGSRPLDEALRGEAMAIVVRALEKLNVPPQGTDPGEGVAPGAPDWMRPFVRKAVHYGVSSGDRPLATATRSEAMTMAVRALDRVLTHLGQPPTDPGLDPLERAQQEGISDGTRPQDAALRGEAVAMAVRVVQRFVQA
jgi:hypothetical protein